MNPVITAKDLKPFEGHYIKNFKCYRQQQDWSCGPASIRSIMNFYGYKVSEKELIHDGDVEEEGTSFEQIRAIAKIHNFTLRTRQHGSFNAIKKLLKKNIPVLVDYQSGSNTGQDGHYTVVVGLDLFYIWLADSSNYVEGDLKSKFVPINRMRKTTFLEHWWDTDADLPTGKVIGWYGVLKPMEI